MARPLLTPEHHGGSHSRLPARWPECDMKFVVRNAMPLSAIGLMLGSIAAGAQSATVTPGEIAQQVRKHLMSLPYYGVFDLLTLNVADNDVVTLGGYVVTPTLKKDAGREAREVKGVAEVRNKIEISPVSQIDDEIRHGEYHVIYGDAALSRYGTVRNDEMLSMRPGFRPWGAGFGGWGEGFGERSAGFGRRGIAGRPFGSPRFEAAPLYGYDPIGNYAIHILVKNRVVMLAGVVDNEADKNLAGIKARGIKDVTGVNNDLEVSPQP
jgi:osmotically-inducible protein OsmY